tara:strand:+ start:325 stop:1107 length:783 start_codon:yes stop_codon:yes gene_type:complete
MSKGFTNFLKDMDSVLHDKYVMERYKEGLSGTHRPVEDPKFDFKKPVFKKKLDLPLASTNARASDYLKKRKLNPTKFYYADRFKHFCNTVKPTFESSKNDHGRIVIPLYDSDDTLIGFQGRSLDSFVTPKYLTVMMSEDHPKVYGLNKIDPSKQVYVTEGPFDSHFISNSIAMCGSDVDLRTFNYSFVYVFDNEPRSREIVAKIAKTIENSYPVVIFPQNILQKDLNDMVLAGHDVQNIVDSNTYKGLEAKLKLNNWKRI